MFLNSNQVRRGGVRGFTLLELLAGVAVGSFLLLFAFQLLTYLTAARNRLKQRGLRSHRRNVLWTVLSRDLASYPVEGKELEGTEKELTFLTVVPEGKDQLQLRTKVQYTVEPAPEGEKLYRRWKWVDLHEQYRPKELLAQQPDILFEYSAGTGRWVNNTDRLESAVEKLRLRLGESKLDFDRLLTPPVKRPEVRD